MVFTGTVGEPVTMTVGGNPAMVDANNNWRGHATVTTGANAIPLVATDIDHNTTNKTINVNVSGGAARTLLYDANGNLTNDGNGKAYGWDAANRLISITQASGVTGFVYDGKGRRVQETQNGTIIKQWVWCGGAQPCEERDGTNNVTKRFYKEGEQLNGIAYFWTRDHLGSVREMTDSAGNLVARYDFDPYGRRTLVSGTDLADFGFTGDYYHAASGLNLTLYRAYDANLGRWLSRDKLGELGPDGPDVYLYVLNNPINHRDPTGQFTLVEGLVGAAVIAGAAFIYGIQWAMHHPITIHSSCPGKKVENCKLQSETSLGDGFWHCIYQCGDGAKIGRVLPKSEWPYGCPSTTPRL